jgi:hypothetical protein
MTVVVIVLLATVFCFAGRGRRLFLAVAIVCFVEARALEDNTGGEENSVDIVTTFGANS